MIALGACAAVIDDGKILLTKREDFEVWCLPGGHVEDGESMARAAVRETLEETGVEIELSHLVGLYYRQHNWNGLAMHVACFAARPVGGSLRPQLEEVLELRYCAPDALPAEILSGHRRRIAVRQLADSGHGVAVPEPPTLLLLLLEDVEVLDERVGEREEV